MSKKDKIILKIKVEPGASSAGIVGLYGDALKVRLNAPPVDGKANKELIDLLARELDLPKSSVEITAGHSSKNKTVKFPDSDKLQKKLAVLLKTS